MSYCPCQIGQMHPIYGDATAMPDSPEHTHHVDQRDVVEPDVEDPHLAKEEQQHRRDRAHHEQRGQRVHEQHEQHEADARQRQQAVLQRRRRDVGVARPVSGNIGFSGLCLSGFLNPKRHTPNPS
jgi:hypothetical protein